MRRTRFGERGFAGAGRRRLLSVVGVAAGRSGLSVGAVRTCSKIGAPIAAQSKKEEVKRASRESRTQVEQRGRREVNKRPKTNPPLSLKKEKQDNMAKKRETTGCRAHITATSDAERMQSAMRKWLPLPPSFFHYISINIPLLLIDQCDRLLFPSIESKTPPIVGAFLRPPLTLGLSNQF